MDGSGELPKVITVPSVGISVTIGLSGVAQMVFQTHVPQDEPDAWDRVSDRLMRSARRQKAIFELPGLVEELAVIERRFADRERDVERTRVLAQKGLAERLQKVSEAEMAYGNQRKEYEIKYAASGRQGRYVPKGAEDSALKQLMASLEKAEADLAAADADVANGEVTFRAQTLEWDRSRRDVEAKIAEAKALIGD